MVIYGIDNNPRRIFFSSQQKPLESQIKGFVHHEIDVGDRPGILYLIDSLRSNASLYTGGQPSQDLATAIPFDDFDINAVGTLNFYKRIINLV